MKERTSSRKPVVLSESTQRRLGMYALAAGAAGVSTLALAGPAEAKVIYTPAHVKLGNTLPLDLNHDGKVDFWFVIYASHTSELPWHLWACHNPVSFGYGYGCASSSSASNARNGVRVTRLDTYGDRFGVALRKGARIETGNRFENKTLVSLGGSASVTSHVWWGPWMNDGKGVKNRYLGIKFFIKGKFHYGWARMTVNTSQRYFAVTLTGYAYETVAGKPIIAGDTKGPDVITLPIDTGTLGHLALGRR